MLQKELSKRLRDRYDTKMDGNEWMAQFVYASHLVRYGDELRLYFNARNTANMLAGRENIGFAHARVGGATD